MMNTVLGEGMSSRLFAEVRERQGLAYDIHSSVSHFRDTGSIMVYSGVDPKKAARKAERKKARLERKLRKPQRAWTQQQMDAP